MMILNKNYDQLQHFIINNLKLMAKNKKHRQIKKLKKNTAVTFDANERQNYLKANIGAKKRRREFYLKKMENQKKE